MKKRFALITMILAVPMLVAAGAATGSFSDGGGILYTEPVKAVLFSHKAHVDAKGISCDRCHSGLFDMEALKVQQKKDFVMESLYKGKYCGACHNGKAAFASDTQCARCHVRAEGIKAGFVKGKEKAATVYNTSVTMGKGESAVRFKHETHTAKGKCADCHPGLFKAKKGADRIAMADHGKNKYCFSCHDGRKASTWNDCNTCHAKVPVPSQAILFGKSEKAVPFNHKSHTAALKCASCHTKLFPYKKTGKKITFADHATNKDCFACHASSGKGSASYDCNRCHAKTKTSAAAAPAGPAGPAQPLLFGQGAKAVTFNHKNHSGASMQCASCHTKLFPYKRSGEKIAFADHAGNKNCFACHASSGKGSASYTCNLCHKSQASAAPAGNKAENKSGCLNCHANANAMKAMVKPPSIPSEGEG
jgi:c(7)-type cytochrome triheme protein